MDASKLTLALLSFLYICPEQYECRCPRDEPLTQVFKCLFNVTHGINGTNVLAGTNTSIIRRYCEDGIFNATVKCLEDLYTNCYQNIDKLKSLAQPRIWEHGFNQVCNSLEEHARHSKCITKQRNIVYDCLKHNDDKFSQTIKPVDTYESLTINLCRYYKGMRVCTAGPVKEMCDKNIGKLMSDFILTITPLMCSAGSRSRHSSSSASSNLYKSEHLCNSFVLVICIVLYNKIFGWYAYSKGTER